MADRSHEALTEQELHDLDAADGVIDGKVHGADLRNFTHDATKSTREGEWEFRDGKYWRRDYYGAALPPKKVEAPVPREIVREVVKEADHSECRRLIEQKETLIRELHRLLAERDTTITTLKARIASLLATIEKLEIRITTLETEIRTYTSVQVAPAPIVVQEPNSYYVTRSNRGAALLQAYGKSDIVVGQYGMYGHGYQPVTGFTPVVPSVHQQTHFTQAAYSVLPQTMSQVTVSAPRTTTHTTVRESAHVRTGENEYYNVSDEAMRARLDAMDGVIDGKLNGVDIRLGGGSHLHTTTTERVIEDTHGREYYNVDSEAMRAKLDAMDGVIDGKFDGREINVRGSSHGSNHGHRSTTRTTVNGASGSGREYYRADSAADAARLDAMDGVIDGRLHGTDIVTKGGERIKRKK